MQSCPGCGLSLEDSAIFCPTCGWQKAAATTHGTPAGAPVTSGAAPDEIRPTAPGATLGSNPIDEAGTTRKALGYVLLSAGVVLSLVAWSYATEWLRRSTFKSLQLSPVLASQWTVPVLLVCLFVLLTVFGSIYPPALDRFLRWFDRQGWLPLVLWVNGALLALMLVRMLAAML